MNHVVMEESGKVQAMNHESSPSDLHNVVDYALPPIMYAVAGAGLVEMRMLNMLASGSCEIQAPLDGGESDEYRRLIEDVVVPLYSRGLALCTPHMHPFYRTRRITAYGYVFSAKGQQQTQPKGQQNVISYNLHHAESATGCDALPSAGNAATAAAAAAYKAYLSGQKSSLVENVVYPISLNLNNFTCSSLSDLNMFNCIENWSAWVNSSHSSNTSDLLSSKPHIRAVLWLTCLCQLGLVSSSSSNSSSNSNSNSNSTAAAKLASTISSKASPALLALNGFDELVLVALILLKHSCLSNSPWSVCYNSPSSSPPSSHPDTNPKQNLLRSRLACLLAFTTNSALPKLFINRDYLAFFSAASLVIDSLGSLIQATLLSLFLQNKISHTFLTSHSDLLDFCCSLPFVHFAFTALPHLSTSYFISNVSNAEIVNSFHQKSKISIDLIDQFASLLSECADVLADISTDTSKTSVSTPSPTNNNNNNNNNNNISWNSWSFTTLSKNNISLSLA